MNICICVCVMSVYITFWWYMKRPICILYVRHLKFYTTWVLYNIHHGWPSLDWSTILYKLLSICSMIFGIYSFQQLFCLMINYFFLHTANIHSYNILSFCAYHNYFINFSHFCKYYFCYWSMLALWSGLQCKQLFFSLIPPTNIQIPFTKTTWIMRSYIKSLIEL